MSNETTPGAVPKLRFPEFRDDTSWVGTSVGSIVEQYFEKSNLNNQFPVLTSSREGLYFQRDYYNDRDVASADTTGYNVVPRGYFTYRHMSDDLVFKFNINDLCDKGIVSTLYPVFKAHVSRVVPFFLKTLLNEGSEFKAFANSQKQGGSRTYMYFSKLKELIVTLPSIKEQQKIADCLSSLDELIDVESQKLQALKAHKRGLMQGLFPAEGETVPRLRFAEFMEDWSFDYLAQISENLDSRRIPITQSDRVKGEIPYYGASGVIDHVNEYIFDEELLCVSEDGANLIARTTPIAFSISGKTWVNNHAHVLRFEKRCTQILVENYLNATNLEDFLTGMAQPKLNRAKLDLIPIPLPKLEEQQKIADTIAPLNDLLDAQVERISMLTLHKRALMQGLFPLVGTPK